MSINYTADCKNYGYKFIEDKFIPDGKDEYYIRNEQIKKVLGGAVPQWQNLTAAQIEILEKNNNTSADWQKVLVTKNFDPNSIKNSS
ncbi:MAG: hypothetical protein J6U06_09925, partial [Spirochaetaceae bacterium]|nr:hypothetical protein [Spirochaetaceae bacterium]